MVRIRTKREVDLIAASCQIVADTLNMLTEYVKPGTSILELDSKAETFIRNKGARPAFKTDSTEPFLAAVDQDLLIIFGQNFFDSIFRKIYSVDSPPHFILEFETTSTYE